MTDDIRIGFIKEAAPKGSRVTVYFENGTSLRLTADNDLTSMQVSVIGDRVFSQDVAQEIFYRTTNLFRTRPVPLITVVEEELFYPYLSVFINNSDQLVSTYSGGQKVIGNLPFSRFRAVNLNHFGKGVFNGVALSSDRSKFVKFSNRGVSNSVKNFDPLKSIARISGYIAWDTQNKYPYVQVDPPTPNSVVSFINNAGLNTSYYDPVLLNINSINHGGNGAYDPSNRTVQFQHRNRYGDYEQDWIENAFEFIYFWQNPNYNYNTILRAPQAMASNPFTISYTDSKPIKNANRQLETIGLNTVSINYDFANGGRVFFMPELSEYHISSLSYITTEEVSHSWQWQHTEDLAASDNQVRTASFSASSAYSYSEVIDFDNTLEAFGTIYSRNFHAWGEVTGSQEVELIKSSLDKTPIIVSDHKTIEQINSFNSSELNIGSFNGSYDRETGFNGQFYPPGDSDDIYFPLTSNNLTTNTVSSSLLHNIVFTFNTGDLGIYIEKKNQTTTEYECNVDKTTAFNGIATFVYVTGIGNGKYLVFNQYSFGANMRSALSETEMINCLEDSETYKIAYLDEEIEAEAGYAGYCTCDGSVVHNFHLNSGSQSDLLINLQTPLVRQTQYNSNITKTGSHPGGYDVYYSNFQRQIVSAAASLNAKDVRNFDFQDKRIIVKVEYSNNIYLALCQINNIVSTQVDLYHNRTGQRITAFDCNIISVKKVKTFPTDLDFVFTVDGCAIFQHLDPLKTNLIRDHVNDEVYLASTETFPVDPKNTEAWLFKMTDAGFTFIGVVGGDVSNVNQSPNADYWIKYYDKIPSEPFF